VAEGVVECVPNVSEGRDHALLERLAAAVRAAPGVRLANVHTDPDHHRSVLTFLGAPAAVEVAALGLAADVVATIDMQQHHGRHPRIGALDVLPFVPLRDVTMAETIALARRVGQSIGERHALPVYYYAHAATRPTGRSLPELRHGQYEGLLARLAAVDGEPDAGPARFDARSGAVLVGARDVLVAFNVWLDSADVEAARALARTVRESSGGLPAVQAMGVFLVSRGVAQVSLNLTDYRVTPIPVVFDRVRAEAERLGIGIRRGELVGLAPRAAFAGRAPETVGLDDFSNDRLLDSWLD
jgi:glutamate formiminotransferase